LSWLAADLRAGDVDGVIADAVSGPRRSAPIVRTAIALGDLAEAGAEVHAEARVVDDGDLVTSRAAAARREYEPVGPVLVTTITTHAVT
jgi:hypothetical protein